MYYVVSIFKINVLYYFKRMNKTFVVTRGNLQSDAPLTVTCITRVTDTA